MCGIVGAVAQRDVGPILLEGLKRLEYRGYDSAGMAVLGADRRLERVRVRGKVRELAESFQRGPLCGGLGIAHTRWATHGPPSVNNAHPQASTGIALVHNGIIENHAELRAAQLRDGFQFESETDTEVVLHEIQRRTAAGADLLGAVQDTLAVLSGVYALGVISAAEPDRLIAARFGPPLLVGIGIGEHFISSDVFALLPVTRRFMVLEDGDVADVRRDGVTIYDRNGAEVRRPVITSELTVDVSDKGGYRHFMLKEIEAQPAAIAATLAGRLDRDRVMDDAFGMAAAGVLDRTRAVQIIACGTSYHAGLVARHWIETHARIPCTVDIASEYRHRRPVVMPGTLLVAISQSGETADTLAALRSVANDDYLATVAICNVPESSLTRAADLVFLTHAGPEIGVASTKAFTTQLAALLMLAALLARRYGPDPEVEGRLARALGVLPARVGQALELDAELALLAEPFVHRHHALYLGRGAMLPIAMEGALKLKELSYIHAEAYAAGELKHGPLALVDDEMPVIAVAPNNELLKKLQSNLHEVRARGGMLYVYSDAGPELPPEPGMRIINVPSVEADIAPIVYTVPLQLFAYHVAVLKGADVDQPRNLAKSVTVE